MENDSPTLPSANSANDMIDGKPGAIGKVILHTLARAAIIYIGMQAGRIIRVEPPRNAAALSIVGSLAIEIFVLYYLKTQKEKKEKENGESSQWSI